MKFMYTLCSKHKNLIKKFHSWIKWRKIKENLKKNIFHSIEDREQGSLFIVYQLLLFRISSTTNMCSNIIPRIS